MVPVNARVAPPRITARRLVALALAAVVVGAVAGVLGSLGSPSYRASTTVWVGRVLPVSSSDASSSITEFEATVLLANTEQQVASAAGVTRQAVDHGISFSRIGGSSADRVSFTAGSRKTAVAVVDTASRVALQTVTRQAVNNAEAQVTAAKAAVVTADNQLASFNRSQGVGDVSQAYTAGQQDLGNLQAEQAATGGSAGLTDAVTAETTTLAALAKALPRWQQLNNTVTQAVGALSSATSNLTVAQGQTLSAQSPSVLSAVQTQEKGRATEVTILAIAGALAALLLGLTVLFVADLAAAREAGSPQTRPGGTGALQPGTSSLRGSGERSR